MKDDSPLAQMKRDYPDFLSSERKGRLNPANVPPGLRHYVPLAEVWGLTDDLDREDLVARAPDVAKQHLARSIEEIDDELDKWLAGPEAETSIPAP